MRLGKLSDELGGTQLGLIHRKVDLDCLAVAPAGRFANVDTVCLKAKFHEKSILTQEAGVNKIGKTITWPIYRLNITFLDKNSGAGLMTSELV